MLHFVCQVNIKVIATKSALHFFDESALSVPVLGEQDEAQVDCYMHWYFIFNLRTCFIFQWFFAQWYFVLVTP